MSPAFVQLLGMTLVLGPFIAYRIGYARGAKEFEGKRYMCEACRAINPVVREK